MSESLPTSGFGFRDTEEIEEFDLDSKSSGDSLGFVLEVDMEPPNLQ